MTALFPRPAAPAALAVALLAACALAPSRASAQTTGFHLDDGTTVALGITFGVLGSGYVTVDAILIGDAIDKATSHGWGLYRPGAIFELVWGGAHLAALAIPIVVLATTSQLDSQLVPNVVAASILGLAGGWFLGHAIWSLTGGAPRPPAQVAVAPLPGGALASIALAL